MSLKDFEVYQLAIQFLAVSCSRRARNATIKIPTKAADDHTSRLTLSAYAILQAFRDKYE